jgi:CubicO group peptidase (beta-lactamase class C family)
LTPVAATAEWPAASPEQEGIDDETLRTLVGDKVLSFFPAYEPVASLDAFKQSLTVADLLTMRTGLDWSEAVYAGSPLQRMNDCRCDWLRFVLDWPMREPPGTRWEYVSGGTIVLGGVVGVATGQRIDRFADEVLFAPLGAQGVSWIQGLPDGLPHTGGGLYLRPRDMAKLGALIADGGRWQSRQIVPESWILESTRRLIRGPRRFGNHSVDYGYLWWILSLDDPMNARPQSGDVIAAGGGRVANGSSRRRASAWWWSRPPRTTMPIGPGPWTSGSRTSSVP